MQTKYHDLLKNLEPFIICHPDGLGSFNLDYLGVELKTENRINPLLLSSQKFIEKIYNLDNLSFGGSGMGMPKWVFFDCAAVPGAVVGFGVRASRLTESDCKTLEAKGDELIPISMYIAIPCAQGGWFGHNLSSLNGRIEFECSGLGLLTKYYAIGLLNIKNLTGATQWNSHALGLHLKLGPLKLVTSYTPVHSIPTTLCYEASEFYTESGVFDDATEVKQQTELFTATPENIYELQLKIEKGLKYSLQKGLKNNKYILKLI
jgi:hypothetical protein